MATIKNATPEPERLTVEIEGRTYVETKRDLPWNAADDYFISTFEPAPLTLDDLTRIAYEAFPTSHKTGFDAAYWATKDEWRAGIAAAFAAAGHPLPETEGDRLVAQPEPAPERPEWVRLRISGLGEAMGQVVRAFWQSDVPHFHDRDGQRRYLNSRTWWEPADPPTPEPQRVRLLVDIAGWKAGTVRPVNRAYENGNVRIDNIYGVDCGIHPRHFVRTDDPITDTHAEPPAAEWKVGDWFTVADAWIDRLRRTDDGYDANLTSSTPYRVERWQTGDVPGFGPGAIFDQTRRYVPASHMRRCDPPSDPQPDTVTVVLSRSLAEALAEAFRRGYRADPLSAEAVGARCVAALSQEGGQA